MKKINFNYDKEADVLYLFLGKPQKAKTVEIENDFILRLDPKTGEMIGLTIIDFSKHFKILNLGKKALLKRGTIKPDVILKQLVQ
jgi:uncharacterized protein YuzE